MEVDREHGLLPVPYDLAKFMPHVALTFARGQAT